MVKVAVNGQILEISDADYKILNPTASSENVYQDTSWKTISPVQARLALARVGLLDQVNALVTAGSNDVKIWFEYASVWERDHQYVKAFAAQLQLTEKQVDDLFKLARGL